MIFNPSNDFGRLAYIHTHIHLFIHLLASCHHVVTSYFQVDLARNHTMVISQLPKVDLPCSKSARLKSLADCTGEIQNLEIQNLRS